ncbi:MAG: hypothetical protein HY815_04280 [Candidatus Riflebacteria bacterium]|nr:hypothetical protein [Candidatus Riflebacteria bacterium]
MIRARRVAGAPRFRPFDLLLISLLVTGTLLASGCGRPPPTVVIQPYPYPMYPIPGDPNVPQAPTDSPTPTAPPPGVQDPIGRVTGATGQEVVGEAYEMLAGAKVGTVQVAIIHDRGGAKDQPKGERQADLSNVTGLTQQGHGFRFSCTGCHGQKSGGCQITVVVTSADKLRTKRLAPVTVGNT